MQNFKRFLLYLILFLIPIGTKKFITLSKTSFDIPISYGAVFIYLLDILIVFFIILNIKELKNIFNFYKMPFYFLIAAFFSVFGASNLLLFFYSFFHLSLFIFFGTSVSYFIHKKEIFLKNIFLVLGGSALLQSFFSIFQFRNQGSLGLKILGESVIDVATPGVARVFAESGNFLRVYGTMPHANILAAFLFVGFLGFIYLFFKEQKYYFLIPSFLILFSIFLTFSRSFLIISFLGILATIVYGIVDKLFLKNAVFLLFTVCVFLIAFHFILGDLLTARLYVYKTEPSFVYRVNYNLIGLELIKNNPIFGVGLGNQIIAGLYGGYYQALGFLKSWQWQPIHNIYLLIASETGLIGIAAFILLVASIFLKPSVALLKNVAKSKDSLNLFFSLLIGYALLAGGFVDHFLWDIESGALMLFLFFGIIKGESALYS